MTNEQSDSAFQSLHDAQRAARMLFMDLRDAGDKTGAAGAKLRADRLGNEIDNLLGKELADWREGAESVLPELSAAADNVEQAVSRVEQNVRDAQMVVNAMSVLDGAIAIAMKLIG